MGVNMELQAARKLKDAAGRLAEASKRPVLESRRERLQRKTVEAMAAMLDELGLGRAARAVTESLDLFDEVAARRREDAP